MLFFSFIVSELLSTTKIFTRFLPPRPCFFCSPSSSLFLAPLLTLLGVCPLYLLCLFSSSPLITMQFYFCFLIHICTDIFLTFSLPLIALSSAVCSFCFHHSLILLYSFVFPGYVPFPFSFLFTVYFFSPEFEHAIIFKFSTWAFLFFDFSSLLVLLSLYNLLPIFSGLHAAKLTPHFFTFPELNRPAEVRLSSTLRSGS